MAIPKSNDYVMFGTHIVNKYLLNECKLMEAMGVELTFLFMWIIVKICILPWLVWLSGLSAGL